MLVANVVKKDVPTVGPQDDVVSAARRLLECPCGILPVVAADRRGPRMIGLLRYWDALAATYGHGDDAVPVAAAMSPPECTCLDSDSVGLAVRLMRRRHVDALPVLDRDGYLVGVLTFADLVREAAR
jgi:CBS domain-containing protein